MAETPVEVAWFAALCDDDYEYLGIAEPRLRSSFEHCREILRRAEGGGFDNILLPSGYQLGIDGVSFAAGVAAETHALRLLLAVRCGELWPPQLARQLATLDEMLGGRLTINIISSDLPGAPVDSEPRYARTLEVMRALRSWMRGDALETEGEFYSFALDPPEICVRRRRCPPFYFGGLSEPAREVAAQAADVYLMWPDRMEALGHLLKDLQGRAAKHGRVLRFGYRVHVIVRETEAEAIEASQKLVSRLDPEVGSDIRQRSLDHQSIGVRRQAELRESSDDDGFAEENLFTGIGRARSGCGVAIVGDPDQVVAKLEAYRSLGIDAFILSGYPHAEECDLVARYVLPRIPHAPLYASDEGF